MREILFKAKRTDNGEWVEGFYFEHAGKHFIIDLNNTHIHATYLKEDIFDFDLRAFIVDPQTICRYTCLTDKNGNKIWENDIVVHSYTRYGDSPLDYPPYKSKVHKKNYAIEWDSTPSYCGYRYHNGRNIFPFKIGTVINGDDEVIGNIFDNPELL